MILVDTSVWIDYFNGNQTTQTVLLDKFLDEEVIIVGDLILTELLQGFTSDHDVKSALKEFSNFVYYDLVGKEISLKSAKNYRYLRKKGVTIRKTIDIIIGTFCIENNIRLLHNDRDFDSIEKFMNLRVVQ